MSRLKHSKRLTNLYVKGKDDACTFDAFMTVADYCYGAVMAICEGNGNRDFEIFERGMTVFEKLKPNENIYSVECGEWILYFKAETVSDVVLKIKVQLVRYKNEGRGLRS